MKLNKEQTKYLKNVVDKVQSLEDQQSELYDEACEYLNIEDNEGWLIDVIYNNAKIESLKNI